MTEEHQLRFMLLKRADDPADDAILNIIFADAGAAIAMAEGDYIRHTSGSILTPAVIIQEDMGYPGRTLPVLVITFDDGTVWSAVPVLHPCEEIPLARWLVDFLQGPPDHSFDPILHGPGAEQTTDDVRIEFRQPGLQYDLELKSDGLLKIVRSYRPAQSKKKRRRRRLPDGVSKALLWFLLEYHEYLRRFHGCRVVWSPYYPDEVLVVQDHPSFEGLISWMPIHPYRQA